jgi:threonine synthase
LIRDAAEGKVPRASRVVCLITGSGFKDREAAERLFVPPATPSLHADEVDAIPSIVERLARH